VIALVGFAFLFGVAIWLVFDWCWYRELPAPRPKPATDRLARVRRFLVEAGVADRVRPGAFVWLCVGFGLVGGVVAYQALGLVVIALASSAGLGLLPVVLCSWLRSRRRARIQASLGDVLAFLQGGIEQGRSVRESLGLLRERGPVALRADFARLERQLRVDFEGGLRDLQERLGSPVWDTCTAGLLLGHRLGEESLAGVLSRLAAMNRDEQKIQRAIKAQQAQVHTAARIACAVPFFTVVGLRALLPGAAAFYASPSGELVLLGSVVAVAAGYWWMLYLGRVPGTEQVAP
jgi:tight adherence protein B